MDNRIEGIPRKCFAFFTAKSYNAENESIPFNEFISKIGKNPNELYNHIRARFSGKVSKEEIIASYIPETGKNHQIFQKLRDELTLIENIGNSISGVEYRSGAGWTHFIINGDFKEKKDSPKGYLTIDYNTFSAKAFSNVLKNLSENNFEGQIKTYQPEAVSSFFIQDDNIVIHSGTQKMVNKGIRITIQTLSDNNVRFGGSSYSGDSNTAEDIKLPKLPNLNLPAKKTSFSDAMAKLACEMLLANISQANNYNEFRNIVTELFKGNGHFENYLKRHYSN